MSADFTPQTIRVKGQDYLEVKQRIAWANHDAAPTIVTELIDGGMEAGWVVMRATVKIF